MANTTAGQRQKDTATTALVNFCKRCGQEIEDAHLMAVTQDEAREFPELRAGDVICAMCFHEIKWPRLTKPPEDEEELGIVEDDWF